MFGYLRFVLAILVMLSHLDIRFFTLNQGVFAVTIFYMLAGYVVSYLYTSVIPNGKYKILLFYKDRIKRIFPLYLYIISLTIVFLLLTNYGNPHFTPLKLIYNITIIPLNYYMYIDSTILTNPSWCLIPPAWSLGTELQAYILLPFAIISLKFRYFFIFLSIIIYTLANLTLLHPDYFGYRFIVGVFFIFLIGVSIRESKYKLLTIIWIFVLILILILIYLDLEKIAYARETSLGILVGIPLIHILSKIKRKFLFNSLLGSISYAIFLSHFLSIWIIEAFWGKKETILILILTIFISFSGVFVEEYIKKLKKSIKKIQFK